MNTQTLKNYLINQICKMKKALSYSDTVYALYGADYKMENLKKIYADLTEEYDLIHGGVE